MHTFTISFISFLYFLPAFCFTFFLFKRDFLFHHFPPRHSTGHVIKFFYLSLLFHYQGFITTPLFLSNSSQNCGHSHLFGLYTSCITLQTFYQCCIVLSLDCFVHRTCNSFYINAVLLLIFLHLYYYYLSLFFILVDKHFPLLFWFSSFSPSIYSHTCATTHLHIPH